MSSDGRDLISAPVLRSRIRPSLGCHEAPEALSARPTIGVCGAVLFDIVNHSAPVREWRMEAVPSALGRSASAVRPSPDYPRGKNTASILLPSGSRMKAP